MTAYRLILNFLAKRKCELNICVTFCLECYFFGEQGILRGDGWVSTPKSGQIRRLFGENARMLWKRKKKVLYFQRTYVIIHIAVYLPFDHGSLAKILGREIL